MESDSLDTACCCPMKQQRTAWAGEVIHQSFANEFWIWWRRGGVVARDLGISDQTIYSCATKTGSTMDLRPGKRFSRLETGSAVRQLSEAR